MNGFSFEVVVRCSSQLLSPPRSSVVAQGLVGLAVNKTYFAPSAWILWRWGLPDKRISPRRLLGAALAWQSHSSHRHCSYPLEMRAPPAGAPCPAPKGAGISGVVVLVTVSHTQTRCSWVL